MGEIVALFVGELVALVVSELAALFVGEPVTLLVGELICGLVHVLCWCHFCTCAYLVFSRASFRRGFRCGLLFVVSSVLSPVWLSI